MKKLLVAVLTAATFMATAQEAPKVTSAIIALRGNELVEAKGFIDEATTIIDGKNQADVKEKIMSKFYYNKALIYSKIAASPDAETKALAADANDIAAQSLLDLFAYEKNTKKQWHTEKAILEINNILFNYLTAADERYQAEDYLGAYVQYVKVFDFKKNELLGENASTEYEWLYNGAICAGLASEYDKSIEAYVQCLTSGYTGITFSGSNILTGMRVDFANEEELSKAVSENRVIDPVITEDQRPDMYIRLITMFKSKDDEDSFNDWLQKGRESFPDNKLLIDYELDTYLKKGQNDVALQIIDEAIAKNPDNYLYSYIKGTLLQDALDDFIGARSAYLNAIALNDTISDVQYMCGTTYFDEADIISDKMNKLGMSSSDQRKHKAYSAERKEIFKSSIVYFKNAFDINPSDKDVIMGLVQAYREADLKDDMAAFINVCLEGEHQDDVFLLRNLMQYHYENSNYEEFKAIKARVDELSAE
jgi:tetratricopeptide (TPR) repeat protein